MEHRASGVYLTTKNNMKKDIGIFSISIIMIILIGTYIPNIEWIAFLIILIIVVSRYFIKFLKLRKSKKLVGEIIDYKIEAKTTLIDGIKTPVNCILVVKVPTSHEEYVILNFPELVLKAPTIGEKVNVFVYDNDFDKAILRKTHFL